MTPVRQEIFEDGKGDCLRACVASILDLPTGAVPNFIEETPVGVLDVAREWLEARGKKTVLVLIEGPAKLYVGHDDSPVILTGESPRVNGAGTPKQHAVVGMPDGFGFRMVHDPHPSNAGLVGSPDVVLWIL